MNPEIPELSPGDPEPEEMVLLQEKADARLDKAQKQDKDKSVVGDIRRTVKGSVAGLTPVDVEVEKAQSSAQGTKLRAARYAERNAAALEARARQDMEAEMAARAVATGKTIVESLDTPDVASE